jgi:hypothetical protein
MKAHSETSGDEVSGRLGRVARDLVPLALLGAVFMVMLAGMALDSGDRWSFAGVGFGSPVLTGLFGWLRRRFTDQDNIAVRGSGHDDHRGDGGVRALHGLAGPPAPTAPAWSD